MINPKRALDSMSAAAWAKKIKLSSVHCSTLDMAKWCQMRPNIFVFSSQCRFTSWNHMTCTVYTVYTFKVLWFAQVSWIQHIVSLFSKNEVRTPGTNWQNDTGQWSDDTKHNGIYNMINQTMALHETVWKVSAKSVGSDVFGNIHANSRERCCSPSGCKEMAGPQSFKIKTQSSLIVNWLRVKWK